MRLLTAFVILLFTLPAHAYEVTVTLKEPDKPAVFSSQLFGGNLEWTENNDAFVQPDGKLNKESLKILKSFGSPLYRFPGGALSGKYVWQDGIGELSDRRPGRDFSDGLQPMNFATDEFLILLSSLEADGMITVNPKDDAKNSAEWLRYISERSLELTPASKVLMWEVGNESYMTQDPSYMLADVYVKRFAAHRAAIKAENAEARVGAILEANFTGHSWVQPLIPEYNSWTSTVLKGTRGLADFYSIHLYGPFDHDKNEDVNKQAILAIPVVLEKKIQNLMLSLREHNITAPVYVTEFNLIMNTIETNWKYSLDPVQAVYIMDLLLVFAQNDIKGACYWTMMGSWNFGMLENTKTLALRPAAKVYQGLLPFHDAIMLQATVTAPTLSFKPVGIVENVQKRAGYTNAERSCNAVGVRVPGSDNELAVLAVNRSLREEAVLNITLEGEELAPTRAELLVGGIDGKKPCVNENRVIIPPASGVVVYLQKR